MKQCLYCNKPCAETAIFCDACRALLLKRQQQRALETQGQEDDANRLLPVAWPELALDNSDASGEITAVRVQEADPLLQRRLPNSRSDLLEQDTPVHTQVLPENPLPEKLQPAVPRSNYASYINHFKTRWQTRSRLHTLFALLVGLAVLAIIFDGTLLALGFTRHSSSSSAGSSSTLAISVTPHVVLRGQMALIRLSHFPPHADVFLTHDIEQLLLTDSGSPLLQLGADGSGSVHALIEPGWSLGSHTIEAEDVRTRDTISTTLQVADGQSAHAPVCGLTVSQKALSFSVMAGRTQPAAQSITLQSSDCTAAVRWQASPFADWLSVTPSYGQLAPGRSVQVTVQVNGRAVPAGTSSSYLAFTTNQQTQLLSVQVTAAQGTAPGSTATTTPGGSSSNFNISPGSLNFNATVGQPDPTGQIVTINNTGSSSLQWQASSNASWLTVSPQQDTIGAGHSEQLVVSVNVAQLYAGNFHTLLVINAAGTQQNITVSVAVAPPCTMQGSLASLSFSVTTLNPKAAPQYITLAPAGGCSQSVTWNASVNQSWLILSPTSGTNRATITASISTTLPLPGTYTAKITLSASSGGSGIAVKPQTIPVTLTVSL